MFRRLGVVNIIRKLHLTTPVCTEKMVVQYDKVTRTHKEEIASLIAEQTRSGLVHVPMYVVVLF